MKFANVFKGLVLSAVAASALSAAAIVEPKIEFQGYKTADMLATAGAFSEAKFTFAKGESVLEQLNGASVVLTPANIDMGADEITNNIVNVFFKNLNGGKDFKVEIIGVAGNEAKGNLSAKVTIGKNVAVVPMSYEVKKDALSAKGQLDLNAFANSAKALKALSDAAAGHKGLSWPLVDLTFSAKIGE